MCRAYKQLCILNSSDALLVIKTEIYDYKSRIIFMKKNNYPHEKKSIILTFTLCEVLCEKLSPSLLPSFSHISYHDDIPQQYA